MAETRQLDLILNMKDKASKQLGGFRDRLEELQPAFEKMAIAGTAAFAGISAGVAKTIKDAGAAEKIADNFEVTFGESANTINKFIGEFGDKFAFVESELREGATSIGFQFNAMGDVTKEESEKMTESLLTAAGGLSDFFGEQMNVADASNALAKGLAGNRAQLIDMGFNVLEEDIEAMAEKMGFATDELTKAQEAQAFTKLIMEQTQGSVKGLEENLDSYTARVRAMRKATKETSETLGNAFLPIVTDILNKITPVINKIGEWIEKNPELAKKIIIASAAVAGIVAAIGGLGLILPSIITGFSLLASPVGIVLAALAALAPIIWKNREGVGAFVKDALEKMKNAWKTIHPWLIKAWNMFKKLWKIAVDSLKPMFVELWASIKDLWQSLKELWDLVSPVLLPVLKVLATVIGVTIYLAVVGLIGVFVGLTKAIIKLIDWVVTGAKKWIEQWQRLFDFIGERVAAFKQGWADAWASIKDAAGKVYDWIEEHVFQKWIDRFDKIVELIDKVKGALKGVGSSIGEKFSSAKDFVTNAIGVDDAIITPKGDIVKTNPADYIVATKNPGEMAGGSNITVNINGGTYLDRNAGEQLAEILSQTLRRKLRL